LLQIKNSIFLKADDDDEREFKRGGGGENLENVTQLHVWVSFMGIIVMTWSVLLWLSDNAANLRLWLPISLVHILRICIRYRGNLSPGRMSPSRMSLLRYPIQCHPS
jgi:hypothetical protein